MKMTLNFSQFYQNWPESRKDQFSYEALEAIFNWMEEYEASTNDEIEYDPISICCEWSEYDSAWDAMEQYQPEDMPVEGKEGDDLLEIQEKNEKAARQWLEERTTVLDAGKKIVLIDF